MRKDNKKIKFEKLGEILGRVFGQVEKENDTHDLPYKVTIFLRAIKFVPEFVFQCCLCFTAWKSFIRRDRARSSSVDLSPSCTTVASVQACTLVDEFLREEAVNPSPSCIRPFESFLFTVRSWRIWYFPWGSDYTSRSLSVCLEREAGMDLPEPHTHWFYNNWPLTWMDRFVCLTRQIGVRRKSVQMISFVLLAFRVVDNIRLTTS